jgi:glycosyltransferase involved in cell wall biosynthesis
MHIAIFPEEDAGWNNPAAEAMAMGCPTVCTNAGTTDFALDGETALIFEARDIDQIKDHCLNLISNKDLRDKISSLGIKQVRQYDWKNTTRQLIDYLELCLTADQYHHSAQSLTQKQIIGACNELH